MQIAKRYLFCFALCLVCSQAAWAQSNIGEFGPVCISLQCGAGVRVWRIDDSYDFGTLEFLSKRRLGLGLCGDVSYCLKSGIGLGLRFSSLSSWKKTQEDIKQTDGSVVLGGVSNSISIEYLGPFVSLPLLCHNLNHRVFLNAGIGGLMYYDHSKIIDRMITGRGATIGSYCGLRYCYRVNSLLSINLELSGTGGYLNSLKKEENGNTEKLSLQVPEWLWHFSANTGFQLSF